MTELQTKEFELLKEFVSICEKLDLKYYLVCGSALGAEKYQGFIPWDDDIDVGLFRNDYKKFVEHAQEYLPDNIFLQNHETDPEFTQPYSKLRNSNTTYIEKSVSKLDINHGIYIDVFPLDGYPKDKKEIKKLEFLKKVYKLQIACAYRNESSLKAKMFFSFERLLGFHKKTQKIVGKLERLISKYPCEGSALICNHGNWQGKLEYAQAEQYGIGKDAEFEGLKVCVPEKIDDYLTQKYDDWRAELPEEKKIGHHYYLVCDASKSYKYYVGKEENK